MTHYRLNSLFLIALLVLPSLALTTAGCSRSEAEREMDEAGDTVRDAAEETKDFMRDTADAVRDATN